MEYLGEKICELCNNHYNKLPSKGKPGPNQWSVLSAVVVEFKEEFSVVTMATGTKCIGEKQRNVFTVSDSHAEVLSLRLFRLYLVKEMSRCIQGRKNLCLGRDSGQKFKVKEGVFFHFYSSCVMCGDATVHEQSATSHPNNTTYNNVHSINPTSKRPPSPTDSPPKHLKLDDVSRTGAKCLVDDVSRTGAKCLVDDDVHLDTLKSRSWHKTSVLRTKPGRGPLSLSLSCSDKLMKRQFLGLQGCILSVFLSDPIRFSSINIGGAFSMDSVKRALFGRLPDTSVPHARVEKVKDLFVSSLNNCKSKSKENAVSASSTSLLWMSQGEDDVHWVGVKGRVQGATKSAALEKVMLPVCRANMLKQAKLLADLCNDNLPGNTCFSIEEDSLKDKYQCFKDDSWYRTNKLQFCKYFEGWDRKESMSMITHGPTKTN